ncbi:MAG: hypothetical protein AAFX94_24045, partial [Myxococcota bacterium]
ACTDGSEHSRAICALVDASGTYADERARAVELLQRTLVRELRPGDSVILGLITGQSYTPENIVLRTRIEARPSVALEQRTAVADALESLSAPTRAARYTDISGGVLLCRDLLAETHAAKRTVLLLSDLVEDLKPGDVRELEDLDGLSVTAINVKRMAQDQKNPRRYRKRLDAFEDRVRTGGAREFRIVSSPERLVEIL